MQTTIATVLDPLVGQVDAQRQTIEHRADRVAEFERHNGRQSADLERQTSIAVKLSDDFEALKAARSSTGASGAPEPVEPTP